MIEAAVELDDDAMAAYLEGNEPDAATLRRLIRKGTVERHVLPDPLRLGLQEQGRAAAARRGDRLPAEPARRAGHQGHRLRRPSAEIERHADDDEPLSMLAFKIMNDPFVGSLTFCRIYSGKLEVRLDADEHGQGEARAHRPHAADACEQPRRDQGSLRRRHRRGGRPEGHDDRRHALRPAEAGDPGAHGVPRAGHRDRHRAELQGRPGEDGRGAQPARRRGSVVPRQDRRGIRPDDHRRHGRAASRHHRRPHEARVQGRGERRPAAGRLSRDDHAGRGSRLHAQEADRRHRPVRAREACASSRCRPGGGFEFENEVVGGNVPREYVPGVQKGVASALGNGVLAGFPMVDIKATLLDGSLPRGRLLGARLRDRRRARRSARACRRRGRCCSSRS